MSGFRSLIGAVGSAGSDWMAHGIKKDDEIEREARLMEREQAMARFRDELATSAIGKNATATANATLANAPTMVKANQVVAEGKVATDKALIGGIAANKQATFEAEAPTRAAMQKEALSNWKSEYQTKTETELKAEIAKLNNPQYLAGKRSEARATHIDDGAGLRAVQIEAAQLALEEAKAVARMPPAMRTQVEVLRDGMKATSAAITKATLDGSVDPKGMETVMKQQATTSAAITKLLTPYMDDKGRAAVGELGVQEVRVTGADGKMIVIGKAGSPAEAEKVIAGYVASQKKPDPAKITDKPTQGKPIISDAGPKQEKATETPKAPIRSTDGGATWTLDVPKTMRNPAVPYYQEIANPLAKLSGQTFKSREEAENKWNESLNLINGR